MIAAADRRDAAASIEWRLAQSHSRSRHDADRDAAADLSPLPEPCGFKPSHRDADRDAAADLQPLPEPCDFKPPLLLEGVGGKGRPFRY